MPMLCVHLNPHRKCPACTDRLRSEVAALKAENERLLASVAHLTESAGDDSCADYEVRATMAEAERDALRQEIRDAYAAGQAHEREAVVEYIKTGGDESGILRSYFGLTPAERERVRFGKAIEAGAHHTKGEGK